MSKNRRRMTALVMTVFALSLLLSVQVFAATVKLNKTKASVNVGKKIRLELTGAEAEKWTTSNKAVATVKNGVVTAKKAGTATIKAVTENKTVSCKVTVKNPAVLSKKKVSLGINQSVTLKVKKVTGKTVWRSKNSSVAYVNSEGKVTGLKAGSTYFIAAVYGKKLKCKVTVKKGAQMPDTSMMPPWNHSGEETPKAGNEYKNYNTPAVNYGQVTIAPRHLYYKNNSLYAECYVLNGMGRTISNVSVSDFQISGSTGKIAQAAFGVICGGASIPANGSVITTFRFPAGYARINASLSGALSWSNYCNSFN